MRKLLSIGLSGTVLFSAIVMPVVSLGQKKTKTQAKPVSAPTFEKDVAAVINKNCVSCHDDKEMAPGGVYLKKGMTAAEIQKNPGVWQRIAKNVANQSMPPEGMPKLSTTERQKLVAFVDKALVQDCRLADPGKVTVRRLNREEYNNTVRDLLSTSLRPADDFPSDDVGYGFDNIGDVLSMSPLLMEKYLAASEKLMKDAVRVSKVKVQSIDGPGLKPAGAAAHRENALLYNSNGTGSATFKVSKPGWYRIRVIAGEQHAGPDFAKMEVRLNRDLLQTFDVKDPMNKPGTYEIPTKLVNGDWTISASFTNDYYQDGKDRNLLVFSMSLIGPTDEVNVRTAFQEKYIPEVPAKENWSSTARRYLSEFGSKAYRRPITKEELDRLMTVFDFGARSGDGYEKAFQLACQAILCNPNFLYRIELDGGTGKSRQLNDYEIASRLSYFLWSSTPDDELLAAAKSGALSKPEGIKVQVKRMIQDERANALIENFGMQWLQLRKLPYFEPDKKMFPTYDAKLVDDMLTETREFFKYVVLNDRSISEFIDSKYTFLNERLAKHYGIAGVTGEEFRKVSLEGTNRGGVVTQASVLAVTSNPTRTSPTKRGKWVLEQILGSPPPPPPPGVGDLKDDKHFTDKMTLRQRMEEHRKNPACATCHTKMDAIGFGFENFDAVGKWRTKDGESPVDSTATLPGNRKFTGATQLKKILMENQKDFARSFTEKMLTFALGRGIYESDKCFLDDITNQAVKGNYKFSSILQGVVTSDSFRKRTIEGAK